MVSPFRPVKVISDLYIPEFFFPLQIHIEQHKTEYDVYSDDNIGIRVAEEFAPVKLN